MSTAAERISEYELVPSGGVLGADVIGFDAGGEHDAETMGTLCASFAEHGVLCFRDQCLSEEQLVSFTRRFGETESYVCLLYTSPSPRD